MNPSHLIASASPCSQAAASMLGKLQWPGGSPTHNYLHGPTTATPVGALTARTLYSNSRECIYALTNYLYTKLLNISLDFNGVLIFFKDIPTTQRTY